MDAAALLWVDIGWPRLSGNAVAWWRFFVRRWLWREWI